MREIFFSCIISRKRYARVSFYLTLFISHYPLVASISGFILIYSTRRVCFNETLESSFNRDGIYLTKCYCLRLVGNHSLKASIRSHPDHYRLVIEGFVSFDKFNNLVQYRYQIDKHASAAA